MKQATIGSTGPGGGKRREGVVRLQLRVLRGFEYRSIAATQFLVGLQRIAQVRFETV